MIDQMKNLLIVTSSEFPYGSASANLLRLMAVGLIGQGVGVEVLIQRGQVTDGGDMQPRSGVEQGVPFRYCGCRIRPRFLLLKPLDTLLGTLGAVTGILGRRMKGKLDTLLVYNNSGLECAAVLMLCKILRIKTFSYSPEWYEKKAVVNRWYRIFKWWDFLFRMKIVNPCFDGLIMPSYFLFNYYKNKKKISDSRLYILPNLVEMSYFEGTDADVEYPKRGVRIGYCGTPTRKDGAEDLIRAFALVQKMVPSAELMIVGGRVGDAALLSGLKQLAENLGVEEHIIFTGLVPFCRMPKLLHSCDILALARPSGVFAEAGFPTKLGEYMACKKPVVLTRVGDLPRYLIHQKNAMLANPDSSSDFADQILWLIAHPADAEEIAVQGYRWAMETLSHKEVAAAFYTYLKTVAQRELKR